MVDTMTQYDIVRQNSTSGTSIISLSYTGANGNV